MDSLSQFALGAAVGVALMGRRTAVWKAALAGGVLGTLPDLDALVDHGDPVLNMVLHRAETHAFFWQTVAAPPIAAALAWWQACRRRAGSTGPSDQAVSLREHFPRWLLTVWLVFVTHALLDAMTVYGTQLLLPFTDRPVGLGSIFIIDPLYTLPLLAGLAGALASRAGTFARWNLAGLALSTAYLGWSAIAQQHVTDLVRTQLAARPDAAAVERVLVTPTAFNTVLWRVVVMRPDRYEEGFYSLRDGGRAVRFHVVRRDPGLYDQVRAVDAVRRIAAFSKGFFHLEERDGVVRITDLRMGQEPTYIFSFAVARRGSSLQALQPPEQAGGGRAAIDVKAGLRWLWRRAQGEDIDPPR